jgi:hypothetical protein
MRDGRRPIAEALDEPLMIVKIDEVGDLSSSVGVRWELRRALARADSASATTMTPCAHTSTDVSPRVTLRQAAFRTSLGSSRSASRYSTRNGESTGPSPGLPRGGGIAERCAGIQSRSLRATAPRNSYCAPTDSRNSLILGLSSNVPQRAGVARNFVWNSLLNSTTAALSADRTVPRLAAISGAIWMRIGHSSGHILRGARIRPRDGKSYGQR